MARAAVLATLIPLLALVVGFLLPLSEHDSVAGFLMEREPWLVLILWPMHLAAAVLAVLIAMGGRRHRERPRARSITPREAVFTDTMRRAAWTAIALSSFGSAILVLYLPTERPSSLVGEILPAAIAGLLVTMAAYRLDHRVRGWPRWSVVIMGYAGSLAGNAAVYLLIARKHQLAVGGYLELAAMAIIAALGAAPVATRALVWAWRGGAMHPRR
jgi:hypothetical protein